MRRRRFAPQTGGLHLIDRRALDALIELSGGRRRPTTECPEGHPEAGGKRRRFLDVLVGAGLWRA